LLSYPVFKDSNGPSEHICFPACTWTGGQAIHWCGKKTVDGYAGAKVDARFAPAAHIKGIVESIVRR
jgi:hypothetical protein